MKRSHHVDTVSLIVIESEEVVDSPGFSLAISQACVILTKAHMSLEFMEMH